MLQCYALSQVMKELGVDVKVLDYYPEYFRHQYSMSYLGKLRIFPSIHIRSWWKNLPVALKLNRRNHGFERFIDQNIPLTSKQFTTNEALRTAQLDYDLFISGSDQVWSNVCIPFDSAYYLAFPSAQGKKKCSYAASFGFTTIPDKMMDTYRQHLTGWDAYSVREASAVRILDELLGVTAVQCCDPTLLLSSEHWQRVAQKPKLCKPYILIYTVSGCKELLPFAKILAESKKMDVVYLPCIMQKEYLLGTDAQQFGFHSYSSASPDKWLGLLANADYVLTDSFHGTVFSLVFHKKFMVVTDHKWGKNNRAKELLDVLDIHDRCLTDNIRSIDGEVNWADVDIMLARIRDDSMKYLKKVLEMGEE